MSEGKRRVFSREFKLSAVQRVLAGESVAAVSSELGLRGAHLYKWCRHYRRGGIDALRPACRPRKIGVAAPAAPVDAGAMRKRISELERKVGQQELEIDFFRQALRRVGEARQPSDGRGVRASTRRSPR